MIAICAATTLRRLAGQPNKGHALDAAGYVTASAIVAKNTGTQKLEPGQAVYYDAKAAGVKLAEYQKYCASPTPNSQLPTPAAQPPAPPARCVVHAFAIPTPQFCAPGTGLPMATPCGRDCAAAVLILVRLVPPRRTVAWYCLPCTLQQAMHAIARDYRRGLLSFDEFTAASALRSRLLGTLAPVLQACPENEQRERSIH